MHPVRLIVVEDMPMEAEIAVRQLERVTDASTVSSRAIASRGVLACTVDSDPS